MLISLSRFKQSLYGLGLSDVLGKFFFLRIRVKHFLALNYSFTMVSFLLLFFVLLLFLFFPIFLLHGSLACTVS